MSRSRLTCFDPSPATTQKEAEYPERLAARYGWRSIFVVSITPQDSRAMQTVQRRFKGVVCAADGGIPSYYWPYEIDYECAAKCLSCMLSDEV